MRRPPAAPSQPPSAPAQSSAHRARHPPPPPDLRDVHCSGGVHGLAVGGNHHLARHARRHHLPRPGLHLGQALGARRHPRLHQTVRSRGGSASSSGRVCARKAAHGPLHSTVRACSAPANPRQLHWPSTSSACRRTFLACGAAASPAASSSPPSPALRLAPAASASAAASSWAAETHVAGRHTLGAVPGGKQAACTSTR